MTSDLRSMRLYTVGVSVVQVTEKVEAVSVYFCGSIDLISNRLSNNSATHPP